MEALDYIETQVLTPDDVELAGTLLRVGDLVAIPTETVYGLGANGLAADAMDRIYAAKGRPQGGYCRSIRDDGWQEPAGRTEAKGRCRVFNP